MVIGEVVDFQVWEECTDASRPRGTLSGDFDATKVPGLYVHWTKAMHGELVTSRPRGGDKILLVLKRDLDARWGWESPDGWSAYMPGGHESLRILKTFSDLEVSATLHAVQRLRYGMDGSPGTKSKVDTSAHRQE